MAPFARVLRFPDFRFLFLGQTASVVGDHVVVVALALYVTERTGSPTDLGLILGVQAAVLVALLLLGGVWADRLPRHRVMMAADGARALLHAVLATLIATGVVRVWEIVVIEAAFGAAQAFFQPAYTGLIPQTVPESQIQAANALTQTAQNCALLLGAALATVLVVGVGAAFAFAFDAATFVLSAALLTRVRPRGRGAPAARASLRREIGAGWREVRARAWVWVTIAVFSGAIFFGLAPWFVLAPAAARSAYGATAIYGVISTILGVGALGGGLIGVRWRPRRPLFTGFFAVLAWPLLDCLLALAAPLWVLVPWTLVSGAGFALFVVWWETALAERIPPHALSRVSSYDWMGSLALLPAGYLLCGPLAVTLGRANVLLFGGAIAFVLLLLGLLPRETRALRGDALGERAADPRARAGQVAGRVASPR